MKYLLLVLALSLMLLLGLDFAYSQPAYSLLREIEESPGQILTQARHSLRDNTGSTWQVVLFKRIKGDEIKDLHLRLVGFPEKTLFLHPRPLILTTPEGKVWQAPDTFALKAPGANVGEYNLEDILPEVVSSSSLELSLPLEQPVELSLPLPVLLEWLTLEDQ